MKSFKKFIIEEFEEMNKWMDHTSNFKSNPISFKGKRNNDDYSLHVKKAGGGSQFYKVHHKTDGEVGSFYVRTNGTKHISVMNAIVDEKHQRQGIATKVYDQIENDSKHTGMGFKPQDFNSFETSDDAKKLWVNRNPSKYKLK